MAGRLRPFLFCRYAIAVGEDKLTPTAQYKLISELQGQPVAHGPTAEERKVFDTLLMRPRQFKVHGREVQFWSVGVIVQQRLLAQYDKAADKITMKLVRDGGVRFNDFIAVPSLSVVAVDDRAGDIHLGGKQAINRFRSVVRSVGTADVNMTFDATPDEVKKALKSWSLTKFNFTIQPNNPRPVSRLAQNLSDQFKLDGIGKLTGIAHPAEGAVMQMSQDGFIAAASGLVDAGYGQMSVAGRTKEGLEAEIKKPKFDSNVVKNEKIQEQPRELRVFVDDEGLTDEKVAETAAEALIKFHASHV